MPVDRFTLPFEEPIREIEHRIDLVRSDASFKPPDREKAVRDLEARKLDLIREIFSKLSAWDRVRIARHPSRPTSGEYVGLLFEEFMDIHGMKHVAEAEVIKIREALVEAGEWRPNGSDGDQEA